jgi:broad specificity phosphatase PhoE
MPDTAYDSLRDKFFNENVAPQVLKQGYGLETARQQFLKETERPGKSSMPRTSLVAKEALSAAVAPFSAITPGPAREAADAASKAAGEAQQQGVSPGPYQFAGSMLGQAPYWAIGMGAAGELAKGVEAGPILERAIKTAAGGLIQGTYDLGKSQNVIEGLKGAAMGAATVGAFESIGPLKNWLMKSGLPEGQASAVDQVAKGVASDPQWEQAIQAALGHGRLDDDINMWVGEQIRAAQKAGVAKKLIPDFSVKGLKLEMTGADGKPYVFTSPGQVEQMIGRITDHLNAGGFLDQVSGSPKAVNDFYKLLNMANPDSFDLDLPLKEVTGQPSAIKLPQVNDEVIQPPVPPKQTVPAAPPPLEVLERLRATLNSDRGVTLIDPSVNLQDAQAQRIIQAGKQKGYVLQTGPDGTLAFGEPKLVQRMLGAQAAKAGVDLNKLINARNSVYHATDLEGFRGILDAGHIESPSGYDTVDNLMIEYEEAHPDWTSEQVQDAAEAAAFGNEGVSVSRAPRVASKAEKAITFVIDAEKMPRTRPYVEEGFGKTTAGGFEAEPMEPYDFGTPEDHAPERNPHFEFEQRTHNEPVPLSAVRGVIVDKQALWEAHSAEAYSATPDEVIAQIRDQATKAGLDVKVMDSGRDVHSYRAGLANQPENLRWGADLKIPLYDQLETQPDGQILNKLSGQSYDSIADAVSDTPHDVKADSTELVRGSSHIPLDERGQAHVDHLGERLALKGGLDHLAWSDTLRTQQTADAILDHSPKTQVIGPTPDMQSWAKGDLEGAVNTPDIRNYSDQLAKDHPDHEIGGMGPMSTRPGESFNQVKGRVLNYVKSLVDEFEKDPSQKIGVVTHFTPIKVVESWVKKGMPDDLSIDSDAYARERSAPAGVYKLAPNEQGAWKLRKVNIDNDQQLQPGIYFIRHGETAWNRGGAEAAAAGTQRSVSMSAEDVSYKQTPLSHRFIGKIPDEVMPEDATAVTIPSGAGQKPSIFYKEANKELIFHENLHGHYSYLGIDDWLNKEANDPIVHEIFQGAFPEDAQRLYSSSNALPEEVFNYAASALRVGNDQLLEHFGEADTSKEHVIEWTVNTSKKILDRAAEEADSIHKRTLERRLNAVVSRGSGQLEDVDRIFSTGPEHLDIERNQYAVREGDQTTYFNDRASAIDHMEQTYQEPLQAPELVPGVPDGTPKYALKVPAPANKPPLTTEPTPPELTSLPQPIKAGTSVFSFFVRPFYDWIGDVSQKFERPDLYSAFSRVGEQIQQYSNAIRPFTHTLRDTIAEHADRQTDFLKWIQADEAHRPFIEQELAFTPKELEALHTYNAQFLEQMPDLKDFLREQMPALRDAQYNVRKVYPKGEAHGLGGELVSSGRIDPRDTNLIRLSSIWVRSQLHGEIVEPALKDAEKLAEEKLPTGQYALGQLAPLLRRHIAYTRGTPDVTARAINGAIQAAVESINTGIGKLNGRLPDNMQIPTIDRAPHDLLQEYVMLTYAGAMAAKPGVLARAGLQTFITGFPLMGNYIWKGMAKSFEVAREGYSAADAWKTAEKYGAFIEKAGIQEMMAGGGEMDWEGKLADRSLRMVQWTHNISRLVSFWGHSEKALDALHNSAHDPEAFTKASDLWFMPKGMRQKYLQELPNVSPAQYEDFSRRIGSDLTKLTQWNYQKGANPGLYKWQLGRLFGQYGTWPLNYIEYARRYMAGSDKTAAVQALARLTLAHGSILAAGASAGIDTSSWVFAQPMAYGGGPFLQATIGLPKAVGDWHTEEGSEARQQLLDLVNPLDLLPGGDEAHQLWQAVASKDPNLYIKMLGFKPLKD